MDSERLLVVILGKLDQAASQEDRVGECDRAELLKDLARHVEHVLGSMAFDRCEA